MDLPHTYNGHKGICSCGKPETNAIHPHRPTQVRHGRCDCGAPVDAICHITKGTP
jgi:hypothetical protein